MPLVSFLYIVSAFDAAETGLEKARALANAHGVQIDSFRADALDYRPDACFEKQPFVK